MDSRAVRNHNPLNIRRTSDKWQGLADVQSDKDFFQFRNDIYGFRAAFVILRNYEKSLKRLTVRNVINCWAPPSENPTSCYIRFITSFLGVSTDSIISLDDKSFVCDFVRAMARFESGHWYDVVIIRSAYDLAFSSVK